MTLELILLLMLCVTLLVIGLFVYLRDRKDRSNRYFFWVISSIVGWLLANYFSNDQTLPAQGLLVLNKAVFVFPAICAYYVVVFSLSFTRLYEKTTPWLIWLIRGLALFAVLASSSNLVVADLVVNIQGSDGIIFGPASIFYFLYQIVYFGVVVPIFMYALKREQDYTQRTRFQYVLAGIILTFSVILVTNLLLPLVRHDYSLTAFGPYATLILITSISYAIVKHRLFQMRLAVARSVAYFLLITVLGLFYSGMMIAVSALFTGASLNLGQSVISVILALILATTFHPLRRKLEQVTDSLFYRDRYDSQIVLNNFSQILVSELNLDRILKRTISDICQQLHIEFGQIVVFDHDRVYRIEHHGPLPKRLMVAPEMQRLNHPLIVADELADGEQKNLLESHGIRVSLTLRTREQFVGYLLLGDKLSGDIYSKQDIEVLEIITKQLAVAVLNAKGYVEIQEFNHTLQARIDHATGRLRVANRHLRELDRVKDEFISMASHQLRTPLTTTKGYLSMLMEGDAGKLTKQQHEFASFAYDGSERMVQLISDLLDVSRLSAGRFIIEAKPTDMIAVITDEVRRLQHHADVKGIDLNLVLPQEVLPLVMLDENKTRQVIMNFIDNAIYYTKAGQVKVILSVKNEMVHLEVRDSGIGVPDIAKKHLFTKFFRADNAQVVRPDGTGLGLFLAKQVIEEQGGTLVFSSTEGKGSTFGFDLPLVPAPQAITKVSKSLV